MNPNDCPEIGGKVDDKKAYCTKWGKWTNCLEVGHCTYQGDEEVILAGVIERNEEEND